MLSLWSNCCHYRKVRAYLGSASRFGGKSMSSARLDTLLASHDTGRSSAAIPPRVWCLGPASTCRWQNLHPADAKTSKWHNLQRQTPTPLVFSDVPICACAGQNLRKDGVLLGWRQNLQQPRRFLGMWLKRNTPKPPITILISYKHPLPSDVSTFSNFDNYQCQELPTICMTNLCHGRVQQTVESTVLLTPSASHMPHA